MDEELKGQVLESGGRAGTRIALFAAGACAGAVAALMLAPARGTDTRAYLGRRGKALAGDVTERGKKLWIEHGDRVTSAVLRGYEDAAGAVTGRINGATESGQAT